MGDIYRGDMLSTAGEVPIETMPFEEYEKVEHESPYVLGLQKGSKGLAFFGARHTKDPSDRSFFQLREGFSEVRPEVVVVESPTVLNTDARARFLKRISGLDEAAAIGIFGESALSIKLAMESGAEIICPEPSIKEEVEGLQKKGFSCEAIFVYLVTRSDHWPPESNEKTIADFYRGELKDFAEIIAWPDFDFSFEHLKSIVEKYFGGFSKLRTHPEMNLPKDCINEIDLVARASVVFRDQVIVKKIRELLKKHNRLFVSYGTSHAVMQEGALRKIFEKEL